MSILRFSGVIDAVAPIPSFSYMCLLLRDDRPAMAFMAIVPAPLPSTAHVLASLAFLPVLPGKGPERPV